MFVNVCYLRYIYIQTKNVFLQTLHRKKNVCFFKSLLLLQITDFGNAIDTKNQRSIKSCNGISYHYAAPEWIDSSSDFVPTTQCDVYRSDYSICFINRD